MTAERGISHNEGVLIQTPPPFSQKIELPAITPEEPKPQVVDETTQWHQEFPLKPTPAPGYFEYLAGLPEEWKKQEAYALVNNPHYVARLEETKRSTEEVSKRLSEMPVPSIKEVEDTSIEERNFRLWQRSLWRAKEFRKATKGRGFMGNVDVKFGTKQGTMEVKYTRSNFDELLVIKAERLVGDQELKEIKKSWKHIKIKAAMVRHTIQLTLSENEGFNSTYLAIERLVANNGIFVPDFSFNHEGDFVHDERGKRFAGWLAITLLQP